MVDLSVDAEKAEALRAESQSFSSMTLSQRQLCDLELFINGAFFPLNGFMRHQDYESAVNNMTLADGTLWPIQIMLMWRSNPLKSCKKAVKLP